MIDRDDIAIFAKVAQLEASAVRRPLGMPGHAMLGFKIDQQLNFQMSWKLRLK